LLEIALEAGVEDVKEEDTTFEVTTDPSRFHEVKTALDNLDMQYVLAEISMIPKNTVKLVGKEAEQMIRLMDALEDSDDVQKASANFDIPEEILEKMSG
ncbi:MAG TPA: YebC/PmpR family DNA-binding transcriptional regulator, partial [Thermodesulfobacteriota bacterium]|nr:YebC/PmpR family DNA-binding transcriptional regulator [Thermodesulfobacteriota bacterium]